ncbi:MAG TPA: hypothetical protein VJ733_00040, partial [Candidatus Binatia bacterium]|nr:hypothetical protein [Candidatus Binatia bacterium]
MALDYPHPAKDEKGVGLHYKRFRLLCFTTSFLIQPLVRAIFFYLASNPRSGVRKFPRWSVLDFG